MLTQQELDAMLREEYIRAIRCGLILDETNEHIVIDKATRRYGCNVYNKRQRTHTIKLSRYYLDHATKEQVRSVIMHEVLHSISGSCGHDDLWREGARRVTKAYNYADADYHLNEHPYSKSRHAIGNSREISVLTEENSPYAIRCTSCGAVVYYRSLCTAVKYPEKLLGCKRCGGKYCWERIK